MDVPTPKMSSALQPERGAEPGRKQMLDLPAVASQLRICVPHGERAANATCNLARRRNNGRMLKRSDQQGRQCAWG
jgi:hypothetical protein